MASKYYYRVFRNLYFLSRVIIDIGMKWEASAGSSGTDHMFTL